MKESFMIGTKFYRNVDDTSVPEVIRLKKQENDVLYFNNGGYSITLVNEDFREMIASNSLVLDKGNKYFREFKYFGNDLKQLWIMENDPSDFFVKFTVENIGYKMSIDELKKNYTRLIPDGFFTISNIDYPINYNKDRGFDVLCTLNKGKNTVPDVICRQDIIDVFRFSNDSKYVPIGVSVPRKACPSNMDYQTFMYAENINDFRAVAFYIGDSIDSILKYASPINRYNATMKKLHKKYKDSKMVGCNTTVRDLMVKTGFHQDLFEVMGITPYPFAIDLSRATMTEREEMLLNKIIGVGDKSHIANVVYAPYDKTVDIDKIDSKHIFINAGTEFKPDIFALFYDIVNVSE